MMRRLSTACAQRLVTTTTTSLVLSAQAATLTYTPRIRDTKFLMEDVYDMYSHYKKLGVEVDPATVDALLEEGAKLCVNTALPLYMSGDDEGCTLTKDHVVQTPKGYKEAYSAIIEGGWTGVSSPEAYGGQGMPQSVGFLIREMMATSNWALGMYPGLSAGAAQTLEAWGSEEQKKTYLTKLIEGKWSGTMCLTEAHCGTDLAQVKTKAVKNEGDDTYRINGAKIFISAGDHDLTENVIHIVLAKLPDAPAGTKGISLFLVPRHVVKADGTLEKKKNVICTGLEHKMGIKASATCQLSFEDSVGYIIGKPNEGMKEMFTFMNAARVGTALQGVAHAELAFQNALTYAKERCSMRALSGAKCPDKPADPIIHHSNVRHNLLFAKAIAEGGRCFILDMARLLDKIEKAQTPEERKALDSELGLLTPIAKGFLTECGTEAASKCQQVFGGHGYIKGNGMEQILRDARISTLYEGTTGIQALDLIGRKIMLAKTGDVKALTKKINSLCFSHVFSSGEIGTMARSLLLAQKAWSLLIMRLKVAAMREKESIGSASEDFLMASGYLVMGYHWLNMAIAAKKKVDAKQDSDGFYQTKIDTAVFYFERVFPRFNTHAAVATTPVSAVQKIPTDKFLL